MTHKKLQTESEKHFIGYLVFYFVFVIFVRDHQNVQYFTFIIIIIISIIITIVVV